MISLSRGGVTTALCVALLSWCGRPSPSADAQPRGSSPDATATPSAPAAGLYLAMAGSDARHTGRDTRRGPSSEPSVLWRVRTQRRVFASPVLDAADRAIFGSLDGHVLAVDRRGVVRWFQGYFTCIKLLQKWH